MPESGIQLTSTNIFQFLAFISPFLLAFFLIISSIFNQDLKGVVYLAGVLIASIINILFQNIIQHSRSESAALLCSLVGFNIFNTGGSYDTPNSSSVFITFTLAYLLLPMYYNSQMNYGVLIFLLVLFIVDSITNVMNKCTNIGGAFIGGLIGFILGLIWFSIIFATNNQDLLYFSEFVSNNVMCSKPSKQTFKCSVYKNGELIKSNIA